MRAPGLGIRLALYMTPFTCRPNAICAMLLPQSDCQSRPSEPDDLLEESQLRQCHSLPQSLTLSHVSEASSAPAAGDSVSAIDTSPKEASRHSKTVRFALGSKSIQYFNPTERPSLVQKLPFRANEPHLSNSQRQLNGDLG
ncbi:hypothetical protein BDV10DRAFT_57736 [Aspergillus recurvatus]